MGRGTTMISLRSRLDQVQREIEKLRAQEALLLDMIREASGEPKRKPRAPRSNVKHTVLEYLENSGPDGTNATQIVETAAKGGVTLERGTVSSLLSRLKNEKVVVYDGSVYRLAKHSQDKGLNVHSLRTSGATQ